MNAAHHAKYRKEKEPELYQELRLLALEIRDHLAELDGWRQTAVYDQNHIEEVRGQLFSIEGRAAHKFNVTAKPLWLRPVLANLRLANRRLPTAPPGLAITTTTDEHTGEAVTI